MDVSASNGGAQLPPANPSTQSGGIQNVDATNANPGVTSWQSSAQNPGPSWYQGQVHPEPQALLRSLDGVAAQKAIPIRLVLGDGLDFRAYPLDPLTERPMMPNELCFILKTDEPILARGEPVISLSAKSMVETHPEIFSGWVFSDGHMITPPEDRTRMVKFIDPLFRDANGVEAPEFQESLPLRTLEDYELYRITEDISSSSVAMSSNATSVAYSHSTIFLLFAFSFCCFTLLLGCLRQKNDTINQGLAEFFLLEV